MAASPTSSQSSGDPHAGVMLDLAGLDQHGHEHHASVEPIPWKTGDVGVIAPLDLETSFTPKKVSVPAVPKKAEKASCGSGCGCKTDKAAPVKDTLAMARAQASRAAQLADELGLAPLGAAVGLSGAPPKKKKVDPKLPGSGIPARKGIRILKWVRRAAQVFFFALFMYFLFQTGFRGNFTANSDTPVRLPLPVEAYLLADPFVTAMTLGATHQVYRGLLW